ncbi:hypothetical protein GCM10010230_06770 [Streptomyces narbonensis]|nr:hypothetical protein GCM10010230_06770 [Streptomyces narbonensis]
MRPSAPSAAPRPCGTVPDAAVLERVPGRWIPCIAEALEVGNPPGTASLTVRQKEVRGGTQDICHRQVRTFTPAAPGARIRSVVGMTNEPAVAFEAASKATAAARRPAHRAAACGA